MHAEEGGRWVVQGGLGPAGAGAGRVWTQCRKMSAGAVAGCVWTRCCVGRAEKVDTEPSAGSCGSRRCSVSIGISIW